jgi:hypothetical protein
VSGEPLEGIAAADALLGGPFPLPRRPLPLARWVEVTSEGAGAQVAWNLDDSRAGAPGRLALYAGPEPPPVRELGADATPPEPLEHAGLELAHRSAPLAGAQPSLRPVHELAWEDATLGLHLRLTAQGPWELGELLAIAAAIGSAR